MLNTAAACLLATPDQGLLGHAVGRINASFEVIQLWLLKSKQKSPSAQQMQVLEELFVW